MIGLTHDGLSNFEVRLAPDGSDRSKYVASSVGSYNGRVAQYIPAGSYILDITAHNPWTATVSQPRYTTAARQRPPITASGRYSGLIGPIMFSGTTTVSVEGTGGSMLTIWLRTLDGKEIKQLTRDRAPYRGESVVQQDQPGLLTVETENAEWSVSVE